MAYGGFGQMVVGGTGAVGISGNGDVIPATLHNGEVLEFDPARLVAREESVQIEAISPVPKVHFPYKFAVTTPSLSVGYLRHIFNKFVESSQQTIDFLRSLPSKTYSRKDAQMLASMMVKAAKKITIFTYDVGIYILRVLASRFSYHVLGKKGIYQAKGPGTAYFEATSPPSVLQRLMYALRR
jgi:Mitochondrial biogenesis AIM24